MAGRARGLCDRAGDKLAGIWEAPGSSGSTPRRAAIERAFLAIKRPGVAERWQRVSRVLDDYAVRWKAASTDNCQATHVRGEQSAEVLDLRTACLQDRLNEMKALTDLFMSVDARTLDDSVVAGGKLESLDRCADVALLRAVVPVPRDDKIAARVDDLRRRLAVAKALHDIGQFKEGLTASEALVRDARALGYKPILAEALYLTGFLQSELFDFPDAARSLEEAVRMAEAGRHDEVKAQAAALLISASASASGPADSERWALQAEATLERLGPGHAVLRAWVLVGRAFSCSLRGDFARAVQFDQEALALKESALGPTHPDVAVSLGNLGDSFRDHGDYDRALAVDGRAIAIFRQAYGDDYPLVGDALSNRGDVLSDLGRREEARSDYQGALLRFERAFVGDDDLRASFPLTGLGKLDLAEGHIASAIATLERALRIRERSGADSRYLAETRFALAQALWRQGGEQSRARSLALQARAGYASLPLLASQRDQVADWLTHHPAASPHRGSL